MACPIMGTVVAVGADARVGAAAGLVLLVVWYAGRGAGSQQCVGCRAGVMTQHTGGFGPIGTVRGSRARWWLGSMLAVLLLLRCRTCARQCSSRAVHLVRPGVGAVAEAGAVGQPAPPLQPHHPPSLLRGAAGAWGMGAVCGCVMLLAPCGLVQGRLCGGHICGCRFDRHCDTPC